MIRVLVMTKYDSKYVSAFDTTSYLSVGDPETLSNTLNALLAPTVDTRITEDGDTRITENGDTRILE